MLKFLYAVRSQLLMPGARITVRAALPTVPTWGRANAGVLKYRSKVRSLRDNTGLPIITTRAPSVGDPVVSTALTVLYVTPSGAPDDAVKIPEICQSLVTNPTALGAFLHLGRSYNQLAFST